MKPYLLSLAVLFTCCNISFAQHAVFNNIYSQNIAEEFGQLSTGDIDGDGLTDIVAAGYMTMIWFQEPGGTLKTPIKYDLSGIPGAYTMNMAVADLDNDGSADILMGNYESMKIYKWSSGTLVLTDSLPIPGYLNGGLTTADFDGDGYTDIALGNRDSLRITIAYRNGEAAAKWDIRNYNIIATQSFGYLTSGTFGPLTQQAIIYLDGANSAPVTIFTFTSNRTLHQQYDLDLPPGMGQSVQSATTVHKGPGKPTELWVTSGGNKPYSKVSVWRGLQTLPDTVFDVRDIPWVIRSANLDCDDDDEPVILHDGFASATVFTDTAATIHQYMPWGYYDNGGLALADVNNDGRTDICFATQSHTLTILYNVTSPCWPSDVTAPALAANILSVYPNPSNDAIEVLYNGEGNLFISDMQGRLLHRSTFTQKAAINLANWATGVYWLRLQTDNGQAFTRKIVKE